MAHLGTRPGTPDHYHHLIEQGLTGPGVSRPVLRGRHTGGTRTCHGLVVFFLLETGVGKF